MHWLDGTSEPAPRLGGAPPTAEEQQASAEILAEMFRVVIRHDPLDPAEREQFYSLLGAINQGASLEGIYNGLTHSADYRQAEQHRGRTTPATVEIFAQLLAGLEGDEPAPAHFTGASAKPLSSPVEPSYHKAGAEPEAGPTASGAFDPIAAEKEYRRIFANSSVYILKRVAGDEALRLVESKGDNPERLALWYSKWAVQMAARKVDFGLAARQSLEENFHYKWALHASGDRIRWEVLNRLHRILNAAANGEEIK